MADSHNRTLSILIADDDNDDRFLFAIALREVSVPCRLLSVNNGKQLMDYLTANINNLPDVLILDLNMPLKNGSECILEIKKIERMKHLPIIIYSTSLLEEVADVLYQNGAHYYLQKTVMSSLVPPLNHLLTKLYNKEIERPPREKFILNPKQANTAKYS